MSATAWLRVEMAAHINPCALDRHNERRAHRGAVVARQRRVICRHDETDDERSCDVEETDSEDDAPNSLRERPRRISSLCARLKVSATLGTARRRRLLTSGCYADNLGSNVGVRCTRQDCDEPGKVKGMSEVDVLERDVRTTHPANRPAAPGILRNCWKGPGSW